MMLRSTCCVLLVQLYLIAILPNLSLGKGTSFFRPSPRNAHHGTPDSGVRNHRTIHKAIVWPQDAPSSRQSEHSPMIFPDERSSTPNNYNRKIVGSQSTVSSTKRRRNTKNKNRDAHLDTQLNKNTEAQIVPISRNSQDSFPNLSRKNRRRQGTKGVKEGRKGNKKRKEGRKGRNQNRSRSKKSIKIKPNKFLSFQNFGMNLHAAVSNMSDKSFVMSPFSAWSALILAYYGSKGRTMEQFEIALGIEKKSVARLRATALENLLQDPKSGAILRTSNKAYIANDMVLKKNIAKMLTNIESLDFADTTKSAFVINNDVSNVTEGKITDLVKPENLTPMTRFILVNAVYFKGKWVNKFNKKDTTKQNFYDQYGNFISKVDMMRTTAYFRVGHLDNRQGQLLEMQYVGSTVVMHILLPNQNVDLKTLVQSLDQNAFISALKRSRQLECDVMLPKFKLETRLEDNLKKAIKSLGITDMFDRGDFSAFTGVKEALDMKIIQQSVIEVDEEGTEAAAATMIMASRMYIEPKSFVVDRPFAFYINEQKSQVTVFSGLYMGPDAVKTM